LLVLLDSYMVTALDLFLDPLAVKSGMWTWLDQGGYFGVPWGNFLGWFTITALVSGTFRTVEYFQVHHLPQVKPQLVMMPVVAYALLSGVLAAMAWQSDMIQLGVIGLTLMSLPVLGSWWLAYTSID